MADVRLYCGPQRSARAETIDGLMRRHWDEAILLVPTRQLGARRTERLILAGDLTGAWGRRVLTFEDFVTWLLDTGGSEANAIDEFERTMLMQDAVARVRAAGKLEVLGAAAASAGFVSHVQRLIAQLKQAAVEPGQFRWIAAGRPHPSPLDIVVAEVYEEYQDSLIRSGMYDRQGIFWEANAVCQRRRPATLENVRVLLLDGFDDFTPSEFRLLESMEKYLDTLVFGLNLDLNPDRKDLYRPVLATAERLRARFAPIVETFEETAPARLTEFASSRLFWRDAPAPPGDLEPDLEIQPCPGPIAEVEYVGRRIKSLILDGVPAEEIAVLYRDLGSVASTIRGVFGEFGIPVRVVRRPCLNESAACAFLLDFLGAVDGWSRDAVVDVLTSPWFKPEDESGDYRYIGAFPSLSRLASIVSGYREWNDRLKALVNRLQRVSALEATEGDDPERETSDLMRKYLRHMPDAPLAVQALYNRFDTLARIAMDLPSRATVCEHIHALEALIGACRLPQAVAAHPVPSVRDAETNALETLRALLAQIYTWCEAQSDSADIGRGEFALRLQKALRDTTFGAPDATRGVACLDLEGVRGLRFDHVFLCGANEGELPKTPPANAVYGDDDIDELERAGIFLNGKRGRSEAELLLFHRVLDVPRTRLTVTYRTLGQDGKEKRPSPYVDDVVELLSPVASVVRPAIGASAFVAPPDEAASWRDLRNAAFARPCGLRTAFAAELGAIERGAALEARRQSADFFDGHDGMLADARIRERLADWFGPARTYSVSQIEAYATCPFAYYAGRILGALEVEPPSEEFDTGILGTILHDVLQAFHHHFRGQAVADLDEETAAEVMQVLTEKIFSDRLRQNLNVPAGVAEVVKRRLDAALRRYLRQSRTDDERRWKPTHFEVTFGEYRKNFEDPLDHPDPITLVTPQGGVLFRGRIDRIDIDGNRARIVDYKTFNPPTGGDMDAGRSIQLPLYALAVQEHLLSDFTCESALFLQVGRNKKIEGVGGKTDRSAAALKTVAGALQGLREGVFPPTPRQGACTYCAIAKACRHEAARIERKLEGGA